MRLYNGAPDDELAAIWDSRDRARAELTKRGLHATWFPMEGKWLVCEKLDSGRPWREYGVFENTIEIAASKAIAIFDKEATR